MGNTTLLVCAVLLLAGPLRAALVFSEDFSGLTDATTLTSSNTDFTAIRSINGFQGSYIQATDPGPIGGGPAGSVYTKSITSGVSVQSLGSAVGSGITVGTLAFDLSYTGGTLASGNSRSLVISSGTGTYYGDTSNSIYTNTDATFGVRFNGDGIQNNSTANNTFGTSLSTTALSADTRYSIALVFNRSGSTVNYAGGSLVAGSADLWINGVLVGDDFSIRSAKDTSAFALKVTGDENGSPVMSFDNVAFYDSAVAIPEPATYGAVAGICLLGFASYRRRHG